MKENPRWLCVLLAVMIALGIGGSTALAADPAQGAMPVPRSVGIAPATPTQTAPVQPAPSTTTPTKAAGMSDQVTVNTVSTTTNPINPLTAPRQGTPPTCPTTLAAFATVLGLTADQSSADHFTAVSGVTPLAVHYFWLDHVTDISLNAGYSYNDRTNTGSPVEGPATFSDYVWTVFCNPAKIVQVPASMPDARPGGGTQLSCPATLDQMLTLFHLDQTYSSHWTVVNESPTGWHYFWSGHSISGTLPNGFTADTLAGPGQTGAVSGDVMTIRCKPAVVNVAPAPLPTHR